MATHAHRPTFGLRVHECRFDLFGWVLRSRHRVSDSRLLVGGCQVTTYSLQAGLPHDMIACKQY